MADKMATKELQVEQASRSTGQYPLTIRNHQTASSHSPRLLRRSGRGTADAGACMWGGIKGALTGGILIDIIYAAWEVSNEGLHIAVIESAAAQATIYGVAIGAVWGVYSAYKNSSEKN